ncbi:MAG: MFS transporter [Lachnospiraceae bacterium]|nr:MFS transporter [Lachnospiraceae bacterium]
MKNLRPVICVCLMSAMLMASQALSPGISRLMVLYGAGETAVSLSITLPYLIAVPFALLAGKLAEKHSLKGLLLIGGALICITGLAPYFVTDFTAVLLIRGCMGIGLGILFTLTPAMAPTYYPEGTMQNLTIGMQSAWAGSGGFVFNILSGYLVRKKTQDIYLVYVLCALFVGIVWILLPAMPVGEKKKKRSGFRPDSLFTGFLTFLFLSAGMTIALSISVYLPERGLGGSLEAGYVTSAYSAAAFIVGCLYPLFAGILKERAVTAACLLSALGMFLCVFGGGLLCICMGSAMAGAGLSLFMPGCINRIIRTAPADAVSMSIAVMMVGSCLGQTFSGAIINSMASLFGAGVSARFTVAAVLFLVTALLSAATFRKKR